jgi:hypothetical protein
MFLAPQAQRFEVAELGGAIVAARDHALGVAEDFAPRLIAGVGLEQTRMGTGGRQIADIAA